MSEKNNNATLADLLSRSHSLCMREAKTLYDHAKLIENFILKLQAEQCSYSEADYD